MNGFFVVYKISTGEIIKTLLMPESDVSLNYSPDDGEAYLEAEGYYEKHYVVRGQIRSRPKNPVILMGLSLSKVAPRSVIYIDEVAYNCEEGGNVELNFTLPGMYRVRVENFPYLDKEFEIDYQPQP